MPAWAIVAVVIGVLLLVVALGAAAVFAWRSYVRRLLLRLLVRAEAVEAASAALVEAVSRLAGATDEELESFAEDPDAMERRTLAEVQSRAFLLAYELDRMPMPHRLETVVEALGDAAYIVSEQSGLVRDEDVGPPALEHLGSIELELVRAYTRKARTLLAGVCEECGLDESSVYGGGLYL